MDSRLIIYRALGLRGCRRMDSGVTAHFFIDAKVLNNGIRAKKLFFDTKESAKF